MVKRVRALGSGTGLNLKFPPKYPWASHKGREKHAQAERARRRRSAGQSKPSVDGDLALERRLRRARLPKPKTLAEYDFTFPKRIPKRAIPRLFDCDFIAQQGCAVFLGPTGAGKSHLLNALGHAACEKGFSVHFTRVVDNPA